MSVPQGRQAECQKRKGNSRQDKRHSAQMEGGRRALENFRIVTWLPPLIFTWGIYNLFCGTKGNHQIPVCNFCSRKRKLSYFIASLSSESPSGGMNKNTYINHTHLQTQQSSEPHVRQGHPRWMGPSEEFRQNVVHWRREGWSTPVFLLQELHQSMKRQKDHISGDGGRWRSLASCSPWAHKEQSTI